MAQIAENGSEDNYYIGATDYEDEGNWRWMNGEKWDYTNWIMVIVAKLFK